MAQALGQNQEKWLKALESGEFSQGKHWLLKSGNYCCLGVGCEIFEIKKMDGPSSFGSDVICFEEGVCEGENAPPSLVEFLALRCEEAEIKHEDSAWESLTEMNDSGNSFDQIAAYCREHPEAVFTEPR